MKNRRFPALGILALLGVLAPLRLSGQAPLDLDPIARSVATTAEEFLIQVDEEKYLESWEHFAPHFQQMLSETAWEASGRQARAHLGPLRSRHVHGVERTATVPGAPDGEYMIVRFRSDFEQKTGVAETVIVADEGEHGWLIAGYSVAAN